MTATQKLPKRISVSLRESDLQIVDQMARLKGYTKAKIVSDIVSKFISETVQDQNKYTLVCSGCLRTVKKLYQGEKCRACLNKTFARLRKIIDIPAKQNLRESKEN